MLKFSIALSLIFATALPCFAAGPTPERELEQETEDAVMVSVDW